MRIGARASRMAEPPLQETATDDDCGFGTQGNCRSFDEDSMSFDVVVALIAVAALGGLALLVVVFALVRRCLAGAFMSTRSVLFLPRERIADAVQPDTALETHQDEEAEVDSADEEARRPTVPVSADEEEVADARRISCTRLAEELAASGENTPIRDDGAVGAAGANGAREVCARKKKKPQNSLNGGKSDEKVEKAEGSEKVSSSSAKLTCAMLDIDL